MRCFQLISLAAVTAPFHQHNHDTPYFNLVIFLPSFSGSPSLSRSTQKQLVLIWKWQVHHGSFEQDRIDHLYRLDAGWWRGSQNPWDGAYPCCAKSSSRRNVQFCGHGSFLGSFGLRRSARSRAPRFLAGAAKRFCPSAGPLRYPKPCSAIRTRYRVRGQSAIQAKQYAMP
jgi:hypothetical protein